MGHSRGEPVPGSAAGAVPGTWRGSRRREGESSRPRPSPPSGLPPGLAQLSQPGEAGAHGAGPQQAVADAVGAPSALASSWEAPLSPCF